MSEETKTVSAVDHVSERILAVHDHDKLRLNIITCPWRVLSWIEFNLIDWLDDFNAPSNETKFSIEVLVNLKTLLEITDN